MYFIRGSYLVSSFTLSSTEEGKEAAALWLIKTGSIRRSERLAQWLAFPLAHLRTVRKEDKDHTSASVFWRSTLSQCTQKLIQGLLKDLFVLKEAILLNKHFKIWLFDVASLSGFLGLFMVLFIFLQCVYVVYCEYNVFVISCLWANLVAHWGLIQFLMSYYLKPGT